MNEYRAPDNDNGGDSDEIREQELEQLIGSAGRREELPADHLEAIRAAFRAEWEREAAPRSTSSTGDGWWWRGLAAAAAIAGLVAGASAWWWLGRQPVTPAAPVAQVVALAGSVRAAAPGQASDSPLLADATLVAGTAIETAAAGTERGLLALRLASGAALRIDAGSRLRLVGADLVELERGAVYVDSGPPSPVSAVPDGAGAAEGAVTIRTGLGSVWELGTQFEVRVLDEDAAGLQVRVREGAVVVARPDDGEHRAEAGEEILVAPDGSVSRTRIDAWDPAWSWVVAAAPRLLVADRPIVEVLEEVARETGWELTFDSVRVRQTAETAEINAPPEARFSPLEALELLPGANLDSRIEDGVLRIVARDGAAPASSHTPR